MKRLIQKNSQIAGGQACIRSTRIPVWTLIALSQQGMEDARILQNFPGLTPLDLLAARRYYQINPTEIDALIISQEDLDSELRSLD